MEYNNEHLKLKDLNEGELYRIRQNNGYSDGVNIIKIGNDVYIGHFWLRDNGYSESEHSGGLNSFIYFNLEYIKILAKDKLTEELFAPSRFINTGEITLSELYQEIYLNIYSEIYASRNTDEMYFFESNTIKNFLEWVKEISLQKNR